MHRIQDSIEYFANWKMPVFSYEMLILILIQQKLFQQQNA